MAFWSGAKLSIELPNLINPYHPDRIDCASYELRLGEQAFVTKDGLLSDRPDEPLIQVVKDEAPSNTLIIGTGQFAFLLTEEQVEVPTNAIALISMKSKLKNKGLVNVSGFHVDPGFKGKLIFAVYNAGPNEIILERFQKLFMIVYADLDQTSSEKYKYKGQSQNQSRIETRMIEGMTGQVFSPMMLRREMKELGEKFQKLNLEQSKLEKEFAVTSSKSDNNKQIFLWVAGILISVTVSIVFGLLAVSRSDFLQPAIGGILKRSIDSYEQAISEEVKERKKTEDSNSAPSLTNSIIINEQPKSLELKKLKNNATKH